MTAPTYTGAIAALLDEYKRALLDFEHTITGVSAEELLEIVDPNTVDDNCRSIQTILAHVVRAGNVYAIEVRRFRGENLAFPDRKYHTTIADFQRDLWNMYEYTVHTFENIQNKEIEELDNSKKIVMRWGQSYDIEQLMEHAIVHILRHRRQIEHFLSRLRK